MRQQVEESAELELRQAAASDPGYSLSLIHFLQLAATALAGGFFARSPTPPALPDNLFAVAPAGASTQAGLAYRAPDRPTPRTLGRELIKGIPTGIEL